MKKDTTALNIRIDTSLYNLLQDATKTGQSKTYLVENALRCYLNVESSTDTDETESDRASLQETVQNLTKEIEHLKGIVKPQEELLAVTSTDKPRPTTSLNSPPKSFGFAVHSLLKEAEESPIDLSAISDKVGDRSPTLMDNDESPIAPTHNAEDESPIDLSAISDKVTARAVTLMDNDESPIDLSPVEVGERSIATGEETSNDNVTKDDNNEPEIAPEPKKLEPLLEITPPETTSEPIKTTHQDESLLKPPETLEMAKIEESAIELLWMDQEEAINWFRLQTPPLSIIETSGSFPNSTIQETIRKNKITPTRKKGESYFLFDRLVIEFNQAERRGTYQYRIVAGEPDRGITKSALSKILGVLPRTIKEKLEKGEANFQEWSEKKDPDGYAWRYSPITERLHRKS